MFCLLQLIILFFRLPEIKLANPKYLSVDALERCEKELRIQMQNYVGGVYIQNKMLFIKIISNILLGNDLFTCTICSNIFR